MQVLSRIPGDSTFVTSPMVARSHAILQGGSHGSKIACCSPLFYRVGVWGRGLHELELLGLIPLFPMVGSIHVFQSLPPVPMLENYPVPAQVPISCGGSTVWLLLFPAWYRPVISCWLAAEFPHVVSQPCSLSMHFHMQREYQTRVQTH